MSSAAIVDRHTGRTIVVTGPADELTPDTLGRRLAQHGFRHSIRNLITTGAQAPRSVVDAATVRYELEAAPTGTVHHYTPGAPGRWVPGRTIHRTHQEHTR